jgi:aminoglycoside phosphotransferase (APT) family kinase protein
MSDKPENSDPLPVQHNKPSIDADAVAEWLREHFGTSVTDVIPLAGGFWSAAFAYQHDGAEFVIRFNENGEGFLIDQAAYRLAGAYLPIPEVFEIGSVLGLSYAISRRHHGRFLELVEAEAAPRLAPALADLFTRMRRTRRQTRVEWYNPRSDRTWHDYLLRGIDSDGGETQNSWRSLLQARPELHELYQTASKRIRELLPLCPERRDLVHGDLLHQNVLISEKADKIEAVFSWKCSAFGDFAYDIAWSSHWAPWHPGIHAIDFFELTFDADDLGEADRLHLGERHHCYELQIATSHIGWYLWTRDEENLALLTRGLRSKLAHGPRSA